MLDFFRYIRKVEKDIALTAGSNEKIQWYKDMKIGHYIRSAIAVGIVAVTLSISFLGTSLVPAHASVISTVDSFTHLSFAVSAKSLDRKAKSDVDDVVGAGTSDKLEGYAQKAKGTAQKKAEQVASSAEGSLNQIQGRAKSDIGQVKGSMEDAADAVEDTGESLVDNVKNFFD